MDEQHDKTRNQHQLAQNGKHRAMNLPLAVVATESHRNPAILAVFAITYIGIAMGHVPGLKLNRVGIALLGAIAMAIFCGLTTDEIISYVNWPTILLLFGFFLISAQLRLSGFYDKVANGLAARLTHPARFLLELMVATAGLSAFLNHDIICIAFTPIVGTALLSKQINPVPFLIGMAIASNIGAGATLIGNPQDMMIAAVAHLSFGRYMLWSCVPVLFALAAAYGIIWKLSAKNLQLTTPIRGESNRQAYPWNRGHTIKGVVLLVAVVALFFTSLPKEVIVLAVAGIHLASRKFRTDQLLGLVDWPILVLFMGLFIVTGAFQATGCGAEAMAWLARSGFDLNIPRNLAITTAILSNLINNSAAVMLLLKIVNTSNPVAMYTLALANSFGGSLLVIGSVSNLIVVQQARDMGINISFRDFARLGIPVTLTALAGLIGWAMLVGKAG